MILHVFALLLIIYTHLYIMLNNNEHEQKLYD